MRQSEKLRISGLLLLNVVASALLFFSISILFLVPGDPSHKLSYMRERGSLGFGSLALCTAVILFTGWRRKQKIGTSLVRETSLVLFYATGGVLAVFVVAVLAQQFRN